MSNELKTLINSEAMQKQFAAALPKHLSPERFCRIAITALSRTPKLQNCTKESLMKCLLDLSAIGLEPDGRHAHLIPYGKEATLVVDYKGLVTLVRRSGDVSKIHAAVVCENDDFDHNMGVITRHTYDLKQDRGEPYAAYAQVTLKDGSIQTEIMSKAEIEAIRDKSSGWKAFKSGAIKDNPWNPDDPGSVGEMWKKTAFRRVTKWLTLSPDVNDRIAMADEHEFAGMRDVTPSRGKLTQTEPITPFIDQSPEDAAGDADAPTEDEEPEAPTKEQEGANAAQKQATSKKGDDLW